MADIVPSVSRSRSAAALLGLRVGAWTMAVIAAVFLFGLVDLMTLPGWVDQRYEWMVPLEASWGSLFTFVVAGSCVAIGLRPDRPWPGIVLLSVAGCALAFGAVIGANARPLALAALIAGTAAVFFWLARWAEAPFPRVWRFSPEYLLLAVAGVPLWLF